ncbi:MAG: dephospho-CoA kinase [Pseudomonadota bacterium]
MPRIAGLTGGIGSGKSAVARMLAERGATIIDADDLAREVTSAGSPALLVLVARFGPSILNPQQRLDRKHLARIVFQDPVARADLEAITHPRIAELSRQRIERALAGTTPLVVYVAPLLFERGLETWLKPVILVDVDEKTQRQRVIDRDGSEALARISSQMSRVDKRARADHIIDNRGSLEDTRKQVATLWKDLVGPG